MKVRRYIDATTLIFDRLGRSNRSSYFIFKDLKGNEYHMFPSDIANMFKGCEFEITGSFYETAHGQEVAIRVDQDTFNDWLVIKTKWNED